MTVDRSKCFLTGCDHKTEWMLTWFLNNYIRHNNNKIPLVIADFGMTVSFRNYIVEKYKSVPLEHINLSHLSETGWFKKPKAMIEASKTHQFVCWIDTDVEILDDISGVFNYIVNDKLAMVEDRPWTKRRGETWHNTGLVAFSGTPQILIDWAKEIERAPLIGDQEVLHKMMINPIYRIKYITDIPNIYNWLRLQLEVDKEDSPNKKTVHWTGSKGKDKIRGMMG